MLQIQRQALGTLDGTCKTCKHIHATKSKTGTLGLWMGLVKLVKFVTTFMLQNQRQTKHLYRIDSNTSPQNHLGGFYSKRVFFYAFKCKVIDFVENMNLPCQIFFLWKVLDFVEGNTLLWRAEIDLVKIFLVPDLGALY
jgi:hypothetical protein